MSAIPRRLVGQTGFTVSALGLACGQIGDPRLPEAAVERLLDLTRDLGLTLFDTARGPLLADHAAAIRQTVREHDADWVGPT